MMHALIVDDNSENLYLLRSLLQGAGFTVDEARHGAEALTRARRKNPDITISDLLMPVMDGYTLLRHWRDDEVLKHVPFVVYTATYTEPRDEKLAMSLGADMFIVKPCEPEDLLAAVKSVLAKAGEGRLPSLDHPRGESAMLMKDYSEVLVRKLEKKAFELETANRLLREEILDRRNVDVLLQAVAEGSPDGLFVKDREGKYLLLNDAAASFFERPMSEFLGRDDRAIFGDEAGARIRTSDEVVMRNGTTEMFEETMHMSAGPRLFQTIKFPHRDAEGRVVGVIGISRDITDRRTLEDQLRQSQKMEAIGRLAGGVAHDFNNLLTIITGYADILLTSGVFDRSAVLAIQDAGQRAAALTRQLLTFSRQTMLKPQLFNLNTVIAETEKMLRRLIGEDIELTVNLDPGLDRIQADPAQLDQILMNLAVNARDAMPRGGRLNIETKNVMVDNVYPGAHLDCRPGRHVKLSVTDTGHGMTREVLNRIFEPFFTTKETGKGTGLGLAMVYGVVQQSGGCIHVYSEPDFGSSFHLYFPAAPAPDAAGENWNRRASGGSETILLVEDEEGLRYLGIRILEGFGYKVLAAGSGPEALRIIESSEQPIDLILTDVVMPQMSGPELVEKAQELKPGLKAVFMSGYTDDAVVRHGLATDRVYFIQKPFASGELAHKVRDALDEKE